MKLLSLKAVHLLTILFSINGLMAQPSEPGFPKSFIYNLSDSSIPVAQLYDQNNQEPVVHFK